MLITFFEDVEDFRRPQGQRYNLSHTLLFSFMAVCCNANTYREIGLFIESHFDKLKYYFHLDWKRAPHFTTIRNHIKGVSTQELEGAFRGFTQDLLPSDAFEGEGYNHIAADGKVIRRSTDKAENLSAIQSINFFDVAHQLILGQIQIEEKTNEIPVFQQLLRKIGIPNAIFTADALHLQKKTFDIAQHNGHKLLIQLKNNQEQLLEDVQQVVKLEKPSDIYDEPISKQHGRIEHRKATVFHSRIEDHILDEIWSRHIKTVICIERSRDTKNTETNQWKRSKERAFYLSNTKISASYANQLVREHLCIENKNQYVKDVSFFEDGSRDKKRAFNLAILRSMALNLFRHYHLNNIKETRYAFSLDWTLLYSYQHLL